MDACNARADFLAPKPEFAVGTQHAGFTVTSVEEVSELSGCAYIMRHDATGARALWLACPDTNKSFAISFKTPPADDTGVFHIIEHSVLCGSDSYPVKEPFVNLLKTSMQTFLNALTFSDKTMYPVASTNTADLENLMGVYLDAVLHPAIYNDKHIFEQEGWHLELEGDGDDFELVYNGVVLNEMRGALSDPDEVLYQALMRQLFPDTAYRFESGGMPRSITSLSYEQFLDAHARHYDLKNSYTILYGDMDIDRELTFIDKRFCGAANRNAGAPNPLDVQAPVKAARSTVTMATAPTNASIGLGYVVGTSADRERVLATDVLLDAIAGSNEAPLKRRILDSGLADEFDAVIVDGVLQPIVLFEAKGLHDGCSEKLRALVEETCAELVRDGIPRERLRASLAQAEFNLREGDWGSYPDGVAVSMQVMASWLYDENRPLDYVRYEDALASLKAGLDEGAFEQLLSELVLTNPHSAEVELVPTEEGDADEEEAELATKLEAMSDADIEALIADVAALRERQEAPDTPEALATLPQLTVADVEPPAPESEPVFGETPLPWIGHELDTKRIDYVYHYFDLRRLTAEELPYAEVLSELMGRLDTASHTASELDTLVEEKLGGLDFFIEVHDRDDDLTYADPKLVVGASALSENLKALTSIPSEVWSTTDFSDTNRMRDILTQRKIGLEQHFMSSGHSAAMARTSTYFSAASRLSGTVGGIDYYFFLSDLLAHWEERAQELTTTLTNLAQRIFTADEVTVSFTGPADDRKRFWELGGDLGLVRVGAENCAHELAIEPRGACNEGFVIPSNVCFVARASAPSELDNATVGAWQVATRPLSYDYLWNEVRVKGGAYGVGFKHRTNGVRQFWSFRDPNIDATLARFEGAASWLDDWEPTEAELSGYVVSTIASHDAPMKPRALARRQDELFFAERPSGWRDEVRKQELAVTADELRELSTTLADTQTSCGVCVFGPREALEASSLDLTITELVGGDV